MKRISLIAAFFLLLISGCKEKDENTTQQKVSTPENWISLFNGKDLTDWVVKINGYPVGENAFNTFQVEDGVMKVSYKNYQDFGELYGHIFYKAPFSNYKLRLEYRFVGDQAPGGEAWATKNSGVMLHAQPPESMDLDQGFPISLEAQFLGGVKEGEERPTANLCTPGTHVKIDDALITEHCINSSSKTIYDERWVQMEALVLGDSLISHSIDGDEVIRYTNPVFGGDFTPDDQQWKTKEGQPLKSGYIALQSESHPIEFRNIKLLKLD